MKHVPDSTGIPGAARRPSKGELTRAAILDAAIQVARQVGLDGVTIGTLADRMQMSKSGVFAHFGSKEELQLAVLTEAQERFRMEVVVPGLAAPRGLARLRKFFHLWLEWGLNVQRTGGCVLIAAAAEFDDQPGPVRDAIVEQQMQWRTNLAKTLSLCVETGELRPDLDCAQVAFEVFAIYLAAHHDGRLFGADAAKTRAIQALERLVEACKPK